MARVARNKEFDEESKVEASNESIAESSNIETAAPVVEPIADKPIAKKAYQTKKDIPLNTMVACRNGTRGKLIYVSKKQNGYEVIWERFGDEEYIELSELVSMRNTARDFFKNNWILIDDNDILDFLGIKAFYENALTVDDFDKLFEESSEEITEKVSRMSAGLKETVGMRAKELIDEGTLDSRKRIEALEKALGWNLSNGV